MLEPNSPPDTCTGGPPLKFDWDRLPALLVKHEDEFAAAKVAVVDRYHRLTIPAGTKRKTIENWCALALLDELVVRNVPRSDGILLASDHLAAVFRYLDALRLNPQQGHA